MVVFLDYVKEQNRGRATRKETS